MGWGWRGAPWKLTFSVFMGWGWEVQHYDPEGGGHMEYVVPFLETLQSLVSPMEG